MEISTARNCVTATIDRSDTGGFVSMHFITAMTQSAAENICCSIPTKDHNHMQLHIQ